MRIPLKSIDMHRRSLLRAATLAVASAVAGCQRNTSEELGEPAPAASLTMYPVSDRDIAWRVHHGVRDDGSERAEIVSTAVAEGSATHRAIDPPIQDDDRLVFDGAIYRVSRTAEEREPATVYPIVLENLAHDGVERPSDAAEVDFEDLPAVDREKLGGSADRVTLGVGTSLVYTDPERDASRLVPSSGHVVLTLGPDRRGLFSGRGQPRAEEMVTYRYTVGVVEESAAAYGRRLREAHAVDLSGVPSDEAGMVETAADGDDAYEVPPDETPGESFRSLAERFRGAYHVLAEREGHESDPDRLPGTYLAGYEGKIYWTRLYVNESATWWSDDATT